MGAKESASSGLANNELSVVRLDHIGKLSRQLFEIRGVHATLGGIAEGRFEIWVASGIDHWDICFTTSLEQLLNFGQRVPGDFAATGGEFVDGVHNIHWLRTGETRNNIDNQKRRVASELVLAFVPGLLVHLSLVFCKTGFPFSHLSLLSG